MNGVIRILSVELHSFEIAFFRNVFGLAVLAPVLLRRGRCALATQRLGLHALRGLFNAIAMLCFFHAITITPLATVAALAFTAPLFATLLAIPVLRERVGWRRWMGLVIGFTGALVILRPGVIDINLGAILVLASSLAWGCALIVIKILGRTESSLVSTTYAGLFLTPFTFIAATFVWQAPTLLQLLWLALVGALGSLTQLAIAQAFREADATLVLPFDFTKIVWASLLGYFVFGEVPDAITILGGAVICAAVTYIAYRESRTA